MNLWEGQGDALIIKKAWTWTRKIGLCSMLAASGTKPTRQRSRRFPPLDYRVSPKRSRIMIRFSTNTSSIDIQACLLKCSITTGECTRERRVREAVCEWLECALFPPSSHAYAIDRIESLVHCCCCDRRWVCRVSTLHCKQAASKRWIELLSSELEYLINISSLTTHFCRVLRWMRERVSGEDRL